MLVVITKNNGKLEQQEWRFILIDCVLYLDFYTMWTRKTANHKYTSSDGIYSRINDRECRLKESDVPYTDELKAEAIAKLTQMITVKKWSERGQNNGSIK